MPILRFLALCLIPILTPAHYAGLKEYLEPARIKEEIKAEIAELDIGFNVDLINADIAEGIGIASQYRYEVEPSYVDSWYSRIDKWVLNSNLRPGDFIEDLDLPISINVGKDLEVMFVRQFKTRKAAMLAKPYSFHKLPLKADWARRNLNPGDFVSLPARLNIVVSAGMTLQDGIFSTSGNTHYLLSGEFQIHIFRMKDDKVRVKIIALRKRGKGASTSVDMGFKIFGMGIVDRKIKSILDMNLVRMGWDKKKGNLFLMDFVYDLKDQESAAAYDQILSSTYKFKNLRVLNPFLKHRDIKDQLISDLTLTNEIFEKDRKASPANRRVDRIFKGSNEFENETKGFKIGFNLVKFSKDSTSSENQISYVDRDNKKHNFYFPTHTVTKERKILFGFSRTSTTQNYFALWPTDEQGESRDLSRHVEIIDDPRGEIRIEKLPPLGEENVDRTDYKDFGMAYDLKDKRIWGFEARDFKKYLQRNIPDHIYSQIKWGDWSEDKRRYNARFFFQVIIHKVGIGQMSTNKGNIKSRLNQYMQSVPLPPVTQSGNANDNPNETKTWQDQEAHSLRKMVEGLQDALSTRKELDDRGRIKKLMDLRSNTAFQELGPGFLISMLEKDRLHEQISITLHMSAKDIQPLDFKFGDNELEELYKELQYVQGVLNNRSFDMRLMKEESAAGQRIVGPANMESGEGGNREGDPAELFEGPVNEETSQPDVSSLFK